MQNIYKLATIALFLCFVLKANGTPKREFRGAWVHTVWNTEYSKMTPELMKQHFLDLLDSFEKAGINAVIFQVRPEGDAFYISQLDPWSRYITGNQGQAPVPLWDPLEFMIEECRNRAMEIHAWFNPFRAAANAKSGGLAPNHLFHSSPYLFFKYGNQLYYNPGEPIARQHIINVIADVVTRYDIDAVHFDDYFYPYAVAGEEIPDKATHIKYGKNIPVADWRRQNVNETVERIYDTIKSIKPWVRLGISPFCSENINYNMLYADVSKWIKNGHVDYIAPQLYWEIGHKHADYAKKLDWWCENTKNCKIFIGQNIECTVDVAGKSQLHTKMKLAKEKPQVSGNIWWPGYLIPENPRKFTDSIKIYYSTKVLPPEYRHIDSTPPKPVVNIKTIPVKDGCMIKWEPPGWDSMLDEPMLYCVYAFEKNSKIDINNAFPISIQKETSFTVPFSQINKKYVVTALDRTNNESVPFKVISTKIL